MVILINEFRIALRSLWRQRSFFAIVIGIIALTVGANGLIFGLIRGVLLQPLPYEQPEKLVMIWEENRDQGYLHNTVSLPNFEDWRREVDSVKVLAAWKHEEDVLAQGGSEPERLVGSTVTSDFFDLLAVRPMLGRSFSRGEEENDSKVVLISEDLWRRRFGSSIKVLGSSIRLDGELFTVIGVMPSDFDAPLRTLFNKADFWRPMEVDPPRGTRFLLVLGRVSGDVSAAEAELTTLARQLATQYPENEGWTVSIVPLRDELVRTVRPVLQILFIAANIVLLIGCTNVANVLVARVASRENEIALRLTLGASRGRLFSLFVAESLMLVLPGSLLGVLLAWACGRVLMINYLQFLPRIDEVDLGGPVLLFALILAGVISLIIAGLVFWQMKRLELGKSIAEIGRRAGSDRRTKRLREALAILQMVFVFPLLVSTILLVKSVQRLEEVDLGFDPDGVIAGKVMLPSSRYGDPQAQGKFFYSLLNNLNGAPGIAAHSAVSDLPLSPWDTGMEFRVVGVQLPSEKKKPFAQYRVIAPSYFQAMGIQQVRGRDFDNRDRSGAEPVLIVNRELARRFFQGRNAVGERLSINSSGGEVDGRIVGVVGDVRHGGPADDVEPTIYVPYTQSPTWQMTVLVRPGGDTGMIAETLRREVWSLDSALPPPELSTLEDLYREAMLGPRLRALVLGIFGVLALSLAGLGIYGIVAYSTAIRSHEIGVRMALGAQRHEILRMILWYGASLCLWGIFGGVILGVWASRILSNHLYGVSTMDIGSWVVVAGLLILLGMVASFKPASGAVQLEPAIVLKSE